MTSDLQRVCVNAFECGVGELVEARAEDGSLGDVGTLKGSHDLIGPRRRLDVRPQWACVGSGHAVPARSQIDRWKCGLKGFCDFFGCARRLRDELVGGKDVGMGNVADVSPVEKVGVIANLEVRPALLEDFGETRHRLPVPFTFDW